MLSRTRIRGFFGVFIFIVSLMFSMNYIHIQKEFQILQKAIIEAGAMIIGERKVSEKQIEYIRKTYNAELICSNNCSPHPGESLTFIIEKEITALLMFQQTYTLKAQRTLMVTY